MHSYICVSYSIIDQGGKSIQGKDEVYPTDEVYKHLLLKTSNDEPLPGDTLNVKIDEFSILEITVIYPPQISNCCGANVILEDVCSDCKEFCEPIDENEE